MGFFLNCYPISYRAKYDGVAWNSEYLERPHKRLEEEAGLPEAQREALEASRNYFDDMPLVNYTTQYGLGCFEGLKALPQKEGGLALFRPDQNALRFKKSMEGLRMPGFSEKDFIEACSTIIKQNAQLSFKVEYKSEWEKDFFLNADSIYLRPFSYSEGGIGVSISELPYVMVIATPVSAYFSGESIDTVTTDRIRATPRGIGWIKASANYVISTLAKQEAMDSGYGECIFLDAREQRYLEEGSSCNIFVRLKSGELVTPELGDTILSGITRKSIIELAKDKGVSVSERKIAIEEILSNGIECFATGTAAGVTPIRSLTHKGEKVVFSDGKEGELTTELRKTLKGIQYGLLPDTKGWMFPIT